MESARGVNLRTLLPLFGTIPDIAVNGLAVDSRRVQAGDIFLAVPGTQGDGRHYIDQAINRGAVCVLAEASGLERIDNSKVPLIPVADLATQVGDIASRFYGNPSASLRVTAVTGTNGKTSCSHFIANALSALGCHAGIIGTLGYGTKGQLKDFGLTTPGPLDLQRYLREMADAGIQAVTLEASSHGLAQGRLQGTHVSTAVFTNLTRDHMDYHGSLVDYQDSKRILFQWPGLQGAVLNCDDPFGRELALQLRGKLPVLTYGIDNERADLCCLDAVQSPAGLSGILRSPWGKQEISSRLYGRFNLLNLLSVVGVLSLEGYVLADILPVIAGLETVRGRMDPILLPAGPTVIIDYAHTPDALEKALLALRTHCQQELWCIFGCGGDRDRGKRAQMGEIARRLSDHLMITSDNPRSEDPGRIIEDIKQGISSNEEAALVEVDRATAIATVLARAVEGDIVLIAGKGHEPYQEVNGSKIPYSDYLEVERACPR